MWEAVLWLGVVAATEAFKEPYIEYLYSRKDGQILIEPIALNKTIFLSGNDTELHQNETMRYLRQLTQTINDGFQKWTSGVDQNNHRRAGFFEHKRLKKIQQQQRLSGAKKPSRNVQQLNGKYMKLHGSHIRKDPQLEKLQLVVKQVEVDECTEGASKFYECNHCVCMGGQLYVCTARECEPGSRNRLIAFEKDVNCIEGERIRSFDDCNRCYCGGGQIVCTRKSCPSMQPEGQLDDTRKCKPGTNIPSPDKCNFCACNTKGNIVCTVKSCGPEISPQIKDIGCKPNTWYSLEIHSRCKECYCINGKMSFCYVNLCVPPTMKHQTLSGKKQMKELTLPGALPDHCDLDDYMQDKCTKCYCTAKGIWSCKTRVLGKCDSKTPQGNDDMDHDDTNHTTKKPRKRTTGTGSQKRTRTRTTTPSNIHHIPNNHDENAKFTTPFILDETKYPFEDNDFTSARTTTTTRYTLFPDYSQGSTAPSFIDPGSYEDGRGPHIDNGHGPDFDNGNIPFDNGDTFDNGDKPFDHGDKPFDNGDRPFDYGDRPFDTGDTPFDNGDRPFDYGDTPFDNGDRPFDYGDSPFDNGNKPFDYGDSPFDNGDKPFDNGDPPQIIIEPISPFDFIPEYEDRVPNSPDDFKMPDHTTKRPGDIDSNIDRGPFCINGHFFTQGSDTHCQGCFCTMNNEWKCYSIKGSCRTDRTCNPGKLRKGQKPCSVCYCGIDNKSYCATDETCSYSIIPSTCEAMSCLNHCTSSGASFGICHKDDCVCVN